MNKWFIIGIISFILIATILIGLDGLLGWIFSIIGISITITAVYLLVRWLIKMLKGGE
jgi:uncharacterized membrane protein YdjX (TVP38/TMEM64 family)